MQLHSEYAKKLEEARTCLKEIRNYENSLKDQRDRRTQLEAQIGKLRTASKPDSHQADKIADLQDDLDQLAAAGTPIAAAEAKVNSLRRTKLAQAYKLQFAGLQELGEKTAIVASYGQALISGWDVSETAGKTDYVDGERTAAVRSGMESALAAWTPAKAYIPAPTISTGSKSYAPSFHESHSHELARIPTETNPIVEHNNAFDSYYQQPDSPGVPPAGSGVGTTNTAAAAAAAAQPPALPARVQHTGSSTASAVPIPGAFNQSSATGAPAAAAIGSSSAYTSAAPNPTASNPFADQLNNSPSDLPAPAAVHSTTSSGLRDPFSSASGTGHTSTSAASIAEQSGSLPTVAETGAPITGTGGPSSGVLRAPSSGTQASGTSSKQEEARRELNRRFEEYSGHTGAGAGVGGDLEREMSFRGRQDGESLPAYASQGTTAPLREKST